MFIDGRTLDGSRQEATICIVGAGAAGITIARQFIGTGVSVVVIESGGFEPEKEVLALDEGEVTGLPYSLETSRLRYFGGSTNHWQGHCAPIRAEDFAARPWIKHSGWPFGFEELEPYYARAFKLLKLEGEFPEAYRQSKIFLPDSDALQYLVKSDTQNLRFGEIYRTELQNAPNIKIILNANVTRIHAAHGSHVESMEAATLEKQHFTVSAKYYVLATGGIENARLLLIAQRTEGGLHPSLLTGKFFMDHSTFEVGNFYSFVPYDKIHSLIKPTLAFPSYHVLLQPSVAATKKYQTAGCSFKLKYTKVEDEKKEAAYMNRLLKQQEKISFAMEVSMIPEQIPNRDSYVGLSSHKDALGLPMVDLHWKLGDEDWRSLKQITQLLARYLSGKGYGVFQWQEWTKGEGTWPAYIRANYHPSGTTRMDADEKQGVVDPDGKLHGVDNLYVAGSSLFPMQGNVNPTMTILALALRLADRFKTLTA